MGHLLYAALQNENIKLNRSAFIYGNIAPDYVPAMLVAPHFTKVCAKTINELSQRLSSQSLSSTEDVYVEYSKQLGRLCHFLCDYFCFAHSKDFAGGFKQHSIYENELDSFLRQNCLELLNLDAGTAFTAPATHKELISTLENQKSDYLSAGFSPKNDLCSAFDACICAITGIISLSVKLGEYQATHPVIDSNCNKGYATGDCYVYRMFFYKNRKKDLFFIPELMEPLRA